jgi:hypothetical protein
MIIGLFAFILVLAVLALALSLLGVSSVALMAQASALASQCVLALAMLAIGGAIVAQIVLRNRIAQIYVARRLLGDDAERLLQPAATDHAIAQSDPHTQLAAPEYQLQNVPQPMTRTSIVQPVVPAGWGFDDEE